MKKSILSTNVQKTNKQENSKYKLILMEKLSLEIVLSFCGKID